MREQLALMVHQMLQVPQQKSHHRLAARDEYRRYQPGQIRISKHTESLVNTPRIENQAVASESSGD